MGEEQPGSGVGGSRDRRRSGVHEGMAATHAEARTPERPTTASAVSYATPGSAASTAGSPSRVLRQSLDDLRILVARIESAKLTPKRASRTAATPLTDEVASTSAPEETPHDPVESLARYYEGEENTPALAFSPTHRHLEDDAGADILPLSTPPDLRGGGLFGEEALETQREPETPEGPHFGARGPVPDMPPLSPSAATMGLILEDHVGGLKHRLAETEAKVGRMWRIFERELDTRDAELAAVVEDLNLLTRAHEAVLRRTCVPALAASGHDGRVAELEVNSLKAQLAERDFQNASLRAELLRATGGLITERNAVPPLPLHSPPPDPRGSVDR